MMDEHMSLQEHLNKIKDIQDQLEAIGRTMEEEDMVVITLKSLPKSYEHFIETLKITSTNVDLKFPELCTKLMQQDRWKQQFGSGATSASLENAFAAKYQSSQSFQQKGSSQLFDPARKKNVQCNYCHKFGHMKKDCRQRIAYEQKKQGGLHQTTNVAEHSEQTDSAFYAFMAKRSSDHVPSFAWYIDSGASCHFSHRRDWFIDFSLFSDSVVFGRGETYTVVGRGTIQIQSGGCTLIFLNVYYVLGMEINLLSVSQIMRNSPQRDVVFSAHKCSIIDRDTSLTVAVGLEDHGLYRLLDTGDSPEVALVARASPINTLWHQRYGHLNMQYLSQLSREGLVSGLPDIQTQQLGICGACHTGKQHRSSFKNGESWRASKAVKGKTPEEVWSGRKPKISHLKVFGSVAYVWIPAAKRSKLDSKSQKLMTIGYNDHHKAYRLIDIATGRLSFSRDVVFDEDRGFFQSSSFEQCSEDQPHSVLLPVGPPDGRDDAASMFDNTLPELPPENNPPLATPIILEPSPTPPDIGSSTLRPKWWAQTIGDLRDDELLEGRTSRHKSKHQSTVNFALMANLHSIFEPQTYSKAKGTSEWEQAMEAEFQSLQKNHTWTLSDLPEGKKPISYKWVYKVKHKADGTLDKYKAHLVA
eukprot:PITA_22033